MTTRNMQALEHKGEIYLRLEDLQAYLASLATQAGNPMAKNALHTVLYKLSEVRGGRPDAAPSRNVSA
jgi:hypothetical protein